MTESCTVVVAAPDFLPGLKARANSGGEVLMFTDAEALAALQTIVKRRPQLIALERMFAVTPRGAALINRIKADPKLREAEIRVMGHNSDYARVVPRAAPPGAPKLDQRGTRRAPRFKMANKTVIVLEGKSGTIIDLSTVGAQVVSPAALRPNQRVSVALLDDSSQITFSASVAWTSFEMSDAGPRYRGGLNFEDADPAAVDAFIGRHKI